MIVACIILTLLSGPETLTLWKRIHSDHSKTVKHDGIKKLPYGKFATKIEIDEISGRFIVLDENGSLYSLDSKRYIVGITIMKI